MGNSWFAKSEQLHQKLNKVEQEIYNHNRVEPIGWVIVTDFKSKFADRYILYANGEIPCDEMQKLREDVLSRSRYKNYNLVGDLHKVRVVRTHEDMDSDGSYRIVNGVREAVVSITETKAKNQYTMEVWRWDLEKIENKEEKV